MNHLLTSCPYTTQIWDQMALIMRTSDYVRDNVADTIADWRDHPFHSPLLNRIWQLLPRLHPLAGLEGEKSKALQEYLSPLATVLD
jgi:hypothetical protein